MNENEASLNEIMRLVETIECHLEQALKDISPKSRSIILHLYGPLLSNQPVPLIGNEELTEARIREARIEFNIRLEEILRKEQEIEEERYRALEQILGFLRG